MADQLERLQEQVREAFERRSPLYIRGGDSKRQFIGRDCPHQPLDLAAHRGVVDYQPTELVLTARAGTPIRELDDLLAGHGQHLPFEPAGFHGVATLGGTVACNLSGPGRPWWGACRDAVLGVQLIDGRGECLHFGGRVMKNVAGYDVSRLQCGALGTLGVLTEISLKVLPVPPAETTLGYDLDAAQAIEFMNRRAGEPRPLSGACWHQGRLYLRLSGTEEAITETARRWGGDTLPAGDTPWLALREFQAPLFDRGQPLWRLSLAATTPPEPRFGEPLLDWCGAQRFVAGQIEEQALFAYASEAGGHARLLWGGDRLGEVRSPLSAVEALLHRRLQASFDPAGILNPGRMFDDTGAAACIAS